MNKITVTLEFTVQPAAGPNLDNQELEVLDSDGDRYTYVNTESEAVESIRKLIQDELAMDFEIDLDGRIQ